ncbi:MAG: Histidinol-phosphate aminotransferase [Alphaproteobacteria bacterium MarineAlpha9_Bin4]|nr:histidinol-phosphate transaminase [Pelagibacterales bacterium]PPR25531.1 MAG: Histidinol-phosphate aminotransferase [Alphaproteobacteria bacterium MarineAlpha9_Bin4]|tara:strand:- start:1863 stop:2963 length:1101 start_codon:yes stop_codon:yes gene_type:complete
MPKLIPYNNNLKTIKPYEPGKSSNLSSSKFPLIKLSSNESCLEFSQSTINKINKINIKLTKYPDPKANKLRDKIAKIYNINKKNIIFGNGSDELFFLICNAYLTKGLQGLYSKYGFLIYPLAIKAAGGKAIFANEINYKVDIKSLLRKATRKTRVCFIANPNNPTGTYLTKDEIKILREKLPAKCLLVIDSAYSEYVTDKNYSDTISFAKQRKDIIVTHTFSKIFGLSAARLGWAYCPKEIVEVLEKIRPAFNVNSYAQALGNIVLDDKVFLKKSIKHNHFWKNWLTKEFYNLGIKVIPSVANFVTIKFKNNYCASSFADSLEKNNIFIRKLTAYKMNDCLRITVGTKLQNMKLLKLAKKILKEKT